MTKENHESSAPPEAEKNIPPEVLEKPPISETEDPDQMLGILSLAFAFFFPLVGLVLGIIARNKSKKIGYKNTLALVGIITNGIFVALTVVVFALVAALIIFAGAFSSSNRDRPDTGRPGYRYDERSYRYSEPSEAL